MNEELKQPENIELDFSTAKDWGELYSMLDGKSIKGSTETYTEDQIVSSIDNYRKEGGDFLLSRITRTGKLRETVKRLKESEESASE